ncbi:MAG: hypothetical protein LBS33_05135 [Streptococcaceae bacterium]|jgi:hypothetical protein|nr:hypothetical protein [Streptococcaceae bacterium]
MRLYLRGNYAKEIEFDYRQLAEKMWFKEKDRKAIDFSYAEQGYDYDEVKSIAKKLYDQWVDENSFGF